MQIKNAEKQSFVHVFKRRPTQIFPVDLMVIIYFFYFPLPRGSPLALGSFLRVDLAMPLTLRWCTRDDTAGG